MGNIQKRKTVDTLVEREGRCSWRPLGVGDIYADGAIDVKLDAFPRSETLQLRDRAPRVVVERERGA